MPVGAVTRSGGIRGAGCGVSAGAVSDRRDAVGGAPRAATAAAAVVVNVGYDHGFGGTIGSVAVGPPEQSQHNIRRKNAMRTSSAVVETIEGM